MTTKRNNTATAPMYTISTIIAMNSAPRRIKSTAELTKVKIKNNTPCTGFLTLITQTADKMLRIAKKQKKKGIDTLTATIVTNLK
ncbi:hypothetical protein wScaTNS_03950 [Wolbachia pipientis]